MDVGSGPVFLSKKRRIDADVSSGLIFLKKKKKAEERRGRDGGCGDEGRGQ